MPAIDLPAKSLSRVIDQYVESRKSPDWPISTAQAVTTIRYVLPQCTLSDRQIADLVASAAIARRRNLAFDLSPPEAA
ncbi:hypothetical protein [Mesorhizobium sp. B1-1-8]|uniref:hypothetical protein n=1 Tax=Mesorhizobium sp. B1-1-8 TaxID=2589976 RepID=UPI001128752F|nr:hypothetical protein [Mesorhizobium sp. B1-1-8]UCI06310.1 hypothetical protein FJ974_21180 [Mesorhizobium sp. B1-1-8]